MVLIAACGVTLGMSTVLSRTRIADGVVRIVAYASVGAGVIIAGLALVRRGLEPDAWLDAQPILAGADTVSEATTAGVRVNVTGCGVTFSDASSGANLVRYTRASARAFAITAVTLSCAPLLAARFLGLF